MTQPTLPTAAAQKQAAVEVYAQYEPPLYEAYLDMMLEWLAAVKTAMFAGGVARLGLVPDPLSVFSQTPKWAALTARYTAQVAEEVLAAPYRNLFADGTLFESRPFVRNWIADRENRLNAVPTEVYGLVAHIIDAGTTNGASIPDVTGQIEQLFADTDVQRWKNRARTVARTEVVGAYNGGLHDAFSMIADGDTGTAWMHRWLSTDDQRTRPDHVEADGQLQPWGVPFTVGGFQMMHPHDPTAPAKEVVNCRCTELMEIKNEPTRMDNRQTRHALAASGLTLMQAVCTDGQFCQQTHKPGLCKGQHRGETEPGTQDATKATPVQVAQTAVNGLNQAIAQAQAVAAANAARNPKLAAMAKHAVAGYKRALRPHQQTLKQAATANAKAKAAGAADTAQQNRLDAQAKARAARQAAQAKARADRAKKQAAAKAQRAAQRKKAQNTTLQKRAQAILNRRAQAAQVAKMSKKQRAAYGKAQAAQARAKRIAAENKTLKQAGRG
jgi:hypothetical protein